MRFPVRENFKPERLPFLELPVKQPQIVFRPLIRPAPAVCISCESNGSFHLEEFGAIDRIDMLCWRLVQEFLLAYQQKTNPQPYRFRQILKIISYLQQNFKKPPDWRMLARQNGLSYRSFQRQWQQSGLPPPNQYVTHLRMEEAKRLLTKTTMPIADIADELHYCDCAWFCAVFRRATGVTPLQYRRRFSG